MSEQLAFRSALQRDVWIPAEPRPPSYASTRSISPSELKQVAMFCDAELLMCVDGTVLFLNDEVSALSSMALASTIFVGQRIYFESARNRSQVSFAIENCIKTKFACAKIDGIDKLVSFRLLPFAGGSIICVKLSGGCSRLVSELKIIADALGITRAEKAVLSMLIDGASPSEIASGLNVAVATVRSHVASLLEKSAVRNIRELLLMVYKI